jgi:D-glycero-alpha-D-manno-heptose-7-phosphate kinase
VDLAGGTVDIWPLYLYHPGAQTVNLAVRCYASCELETRTGSRLVFISEDQGIRESYGSLDAPALKRSRLPLVRELVRFFRPKRGMTIRTSSEVPAGAGMGGSSALNMALCGALARATGRRYSRAQLLEIAKNVEAIVIQVPTGCQDYYPALYGGASALGLERDGVRREPLPVSFADLDRRFVLCYTGQPRNSAINNWEVMKAHIDGDVRVRQNFSRIVSIAGRMREALLSADWGDVAKLLALEWENRKRNFKGISTPLIDRMIRETARHGTLAGKVCGAGGGGCVVFLVEPGTKPAVEQKLMQLGGKIIHFAVSREGLEVNVTPGRSVDETRRKNNS